MHVPPLTIRAFAAWFAADGDRTTASPPPAGGSASDGWFEFRDANLVVRYLPRQGGLRPGQALPTLILGDSADWDPDRPDDVMGSGVPVRYDPATRALAVTTSIVALPPVFVYQGKRGVALASDIHLLRQVPGARLELSSDGVLELGHFGHPVGHRTLFRDVELLAGGTRAALSAGGLRRERVWSLPERAPAEWGDFIEAQIEAFRRAVRRIDVARSFLSLTAGLDTRTVFSALADEKRLVPAATMTGIRRSLDARIAARLCDAYGVRHVPVTFDARFLRDAPRYIETASRLSGGLASIDQAPEVFLYDQVGGAFEARLSGNLGNQVGRGGTEGVSVRGADLSILDSGLRGRGAPTGHWLLQHLGGHDAASTEFILQCEVPFTLLGNFSVGNHFAIQQSPYASRMLIETLASRPRTQEGAPSRSRTRMRLRDLRHRFLGEPESRSFQRTLVKRLDGFAARCPVNWGWRPTGGVSPSGLALGGATLLGMLARATGLDGGWMRSFVATTGLPALHDFRESQAWLRNELREFTMDTLRANDVRSTGLFDATALDRILDEHFRRGQDHYRTVSFALDLALARRLLCS